MGRTEPLTLDEIRPIFVRLLRGPLALAVSGGSDSMALLHLVAEWLLETETAARQNMGPVPLRVVTVDHGLRAEAGEEAAWVGRQAQTLGLPHSTLVWEGPKPSAGIQAAAREARYCLINAFLEQEVLASPGHSKRSIVTAHHADDQAETFLMRLARGSGLDGLSGMREAECTTPAPVEGLHAGAYVVLRPFLQVPKARLTALLEARRLTWREDPSNLSDDSERVRVRRAIEVLDRLGIGAEQMGLSARRLARARAAILTAADDVMRRIARLHGGLYGEIDPCLFADYAEEHQVRTFALLVAAYGGEAAPARLSQIEALVAQARRAASMSEQVGESGERIAVTLGGCRIECSGGGPVRIWREAGREGLPELDLEPGTQRVWDRRFKVGLGADESASVVVRALGSEGVRSMLSGSGQVTKSRHPNVPPGAMQTLPSFWRDGRLLAVPSLIPPETPPTRYWARFVAEDTFERPE